MPGDHPSPALLRPLLPGAPRRDEPPGAGPELPGAQSLQKGIFSQGDAAGGWHSFRGSFGVLGSCRGI